MAGLVVVSVLGGIGVWLGHQGVGLLTLLHEALLLRRVSTEFNNSVSCRRWGTVLFNIVVGVEAEIPDRGQRCDECKNAGSLIVCAGPEPRCSALLLE